MGLDISHCKATLQRPSGRNPYTLYGVTEAEYNDFNVPFSHFHKYIQQIDVADVVDTCIVVKEEKDLQEVTEWFSDREPPYKIFFERNARTLMQAVKAYEAEHGFHVYHRYIDDVSKWKLLKYYEIKKQTGFYTRNEGYQRKGMNEHFGERFGAADIYNYALEADFLHAYNCVDYYWDNDSAEDVHRRKKQFKADFVDKFEAGASYISISY